MTFESSSEVLKEAATRGTERLYESYDEANTESNLVNAAMALDVTLRNTKNAVATGRDVMVLGVPSQELLTDIVLDMPIGVRDPHPMGILLFDSLQEESRLPRQLLEEDLITLVRAVQSATSPFTEITYQERIEMSMNLDSYVRGLSHTTQRLVDKSLDKRRLGHEGADISNFQADIYREFADSEYLQFMMSKKRQTQLPGLTGQVALRLMKEAEWLDNVQFGNHPQ